MPRSSNPVASMRFPVRLVADDRPPVHQAVEALSVSGTAAARQVITLLPGYRPTPLRDLPGLAAAAQLDAIAYKDEAERFGLGNFKALGGAYAVFRIVQDRVRKHSAADSVSVADIVGGSYAALAGDLTVTCATAGSHGRSVAWGARLCGCRAVVYVHEGVSERRREAIRDFGATVVVVSGTYDDAVRTADAHARTHGRFVVSDTSYEGYTDIPLDVMHGYTVMVDEVIGQLPSGTHPTHVFAQGGVGGLAAAVFARLRHVWGDELPVCVVVEPERADCLLQSARAKRPAKASGDLQTIMGGLACGEPSLVAWRILATTADAFMTIPDEAARRCMNLLAEGVSGDVPIVAGESGAAGLAGLLAAAADPDVRATLGLGAASRVLVVGTEGASDPDAYRSIVGRAADEIGPVA